MGCIERHIEDGRVVERDCHTGAVAKAEPQTGPGAELKAILGDWLGIRASESCSCNSMARRMNAAGPDWCEGPGMPVILQALKAEHERRRKAGKMRLPWSELGATMLVRLACRRARRQS